MLQHKLNDKRVETGDVNPLPIKIQDSSIAMPVHVQYREVIEVPITINAQIRDTNAKTYGPIDTSKYARFVVAAYHTHDQPLTLALQYGSSTISPTTTFMMDGTEKTKNTNVQSNKIYILNNQVDVIHLVAPQIKVTAQASTAPTTGSITIVLWGLA